MIQETHVTYSLSSCLRGSILQRSLLHQFCRINAHFLWPHEILRHESLKDHIIINLLNLLKLNLLVVHFIFHYCSLHLYSTSTKVMLSWINAKKLPSHAISNACNYFSYILLLILYIITPLKVHWWRVKY